MLTLPIITIGLPFLAGLVILFVPKKLKGLPEVISLLASIAALAYAALCFMKKPILWPANGDALLRIDPLSGFVGLFVGLFGVAITLYSINFMRGRQRLNEYYTYLIWTIGASIGAAFSNNLMLLLIFWGFLGLTLYMLILTAAPASAQSAKKTFIIVGGSDAIMLFGIAIIWHLTGKFDMSAVKLGLNDGALPAIAFLCLAAGAFAKAGAMPLHTWIPDSSEVTPTPVMALLPASLDKLLGIYLLARLVMEMFIITPNSPMSIFLLTIGAITILAAVMMALVQHNLKRLLAYHAVSQVGYMVIGIGTATPIGIVGGLFHMVNHAIYKSCLFLSGGSVESETHTAELDELGGLASFMPITFVTCLVASLSISGVPPFNGFFSKWLVYQSLLELGKDGSKLWIIWLTVAMFGSALTLASFMKLMYSTFFSTRKNNEQTTPALRSSKSEGGNIKEVPFSMWLPQVSLALLCIVFGVFAYRIPLKIFIIPSLEAQTQFSYPGIWNAPLATILILAGILLGFLFFMAGKAMPVRESKIFVGGEILEDNSGIKAGSFYDTIKDIPVLGAIYNLAEKKVFDIYEEGTKATLKLTDGLRWLHNGVLPTYMVWCLIGMLVIFLTLIIR